MSRTTARLRTDSATRLAELERQRPEWQAWFGLHREAEHELADADWDRVIAESDPAPSLSDPTFNRVPLLHGRTLRVDGTRLQRLIRRLLTAASRLDGPASLRGYQPTVAEAVSLTESAMRQNRGEIAALATARRIDAGALISLAHLAALPLLRASGRGLQQEHHWAHGYCPVCAGWPILAERRGLDRSRWLRCGRCAGAWEVQWLTCVYCGEQNHERLGSLVPEDGSELHKVETCTSCRGYLKSIASLRAFPPLELLLVDLETVEFDLVALDRGYRRPAESGFALDLELIDDAPG